MRAREPHLILAHPHTQIDGEVFLMLDEDMLQGVLSLSRGLGEAMRAGK